MKKIKELFEFIISIWFYRILVFLMIGVPMFICVIILAILKFLWYLFLSWYRDALDSFRYTREDNFY